MAYKPDKHGRDHCPGGEDPIPCLGTEWVQRVKTTDQGITSSTNDTEVTWEAGMTGSDFHTTYFEIVVPTDKTIRILKSGIYEITGQFQWSANKVEGSVITLNGSNFTWNKGFYDAQNAGHTIEHNQTFTYRRRIEASTTLKLYVVHFAAATRTIENAWWEIHHVGSYTGADPTD